jgi:hypothetical protein
MLFTGIEYALMGFMVNAFVISALRNPYKLSQYKTMGMEVLTKMIHNFLRIEK